MAAWNKSGVVTHETLCAVLKEFKEKLPRWEEGRY